MALKPYDHEANPTLRAAHSRLFSGPPADQVDAYRAWAPLYFDDAASRGVKRETIDDVLYAIAANRFNSYEEARRFLAARKREWDAYCNSLSPRVDFLLAGPADGRDSEFAGLARDFIATADRFAVPRESVLTALAMTGLRCGLPGTLQLVAGAARQVDESKAPTASPDTAPDTVVTSSPARFGVDLSDRADVTVLCVVALGEVS